MSIDLKPIDARLRGRICPTCVRFTADHRCSLPPTRPCAVFANLGAIVDIVRTVGSIQMGPYIDAVREEVCSTCHEDDHGACPMRDGLDCALDCYLPIIIDEIEQELSRQRHARSGV